MRLVALNVEEERGIAFSPPRENTEKRWPFTSQEENFHQELNWWTP